MAPVTAPSAAVPRDALTALTARGLFLFPVDHPDLPLCAGRHAPDRPCNGDRGKHPVPCSWPRESTNDATRIARMFGRGPRNVGIDCGRSGVLVLDEDEDGELERLCRTHRHELPVTLTVLTGKGRHAYYRQPAHVPFTNAAGGLRDYRIDVRGRGGYVIGPGSLHQTGRAYTVASAAPIAPVPKWIAELLQPPPREPRRAVASDHFAGSLQALTGVLRVVLNAQPGTRNGKLHWAACRLFEKSRAGVLSAAAAEGMLLDAARAIHLPEGEARGTVASARRGVLGG